MPLAEYLEWQLFAELEPFGSHYDDLRAGSMVSAVYNVNRDTTRRAAAFGPLDFLPWNDMERQKVPLTAEPMTPEEQSDALRSLLGFRR